MLNLLTKAKRILVEVFSCRCVMWTSEFYLHNVEQEVVFLGRH